MFTSTFLEHCVHFSGTLCMAVQATLINEVATYFENYWYPRHISDNCSRVLVHDVRFPYGLGAQIRYVLMWSVGWAWAHNRMLLPSDNFLTNYKCHVGYDQHISKLCPFFVILLLIKGPSMLFFKYTAQCFMFSSKLSGTRLDLRSTSSDRTQDASRESCRSN
jgi:hypothetical protein